MDVKDIKAVIGTNAWGSSLYGKAIRGSAISEDIIKEAVEKSIELDMAVFDTAQDYGLGKCQPMIGRLCGKEAIISSKFTPMSGNYKQNQVRNSLMKDLEQMHREAIDIYWLHLPNSIDENIKEMIDLYREGKILNIGVSNFTLEECKKVKGILDAENIPFYAVQNHYSIINREWEKEGLVSWCKENNIKFWAWAVLEEGLLAGPKKKDEKWSIMKIIFHGRRKKLNRLFALMKKAGDNHNLSIAQVAMAFVATKGIVPVCGCRKPNQVQELYDAVNTTLSPKEMKKLEQVADKLNVKIFGKDIFRFAVKKSSNKKYWQRIAKIYAPLMESDKKLYESICEYIKAYLKNDMAVLELACGSGQLSFPLSKNVAEWTATDFSEEMIAQAKKRGGKDNLHFCIADATSLSFENDSFDCVVISNALHIMPEPEKAMQEISRVLKTKGLLYAPTFLWAEGKASGMRKRLMSLTGFRAYKEWDRDSFQKFVSEHGFEVMEMHMVDGGLAPVGALIAVKR